MTDKKLKLIYEYMEAAGWVFDSSYLDSNSAWEVVQEMERKGDIEKFELCIAYAHTRLTFIMNPTIFFNCFAKWLLGGTEKDF